MKAERPSFSLEWAGTVYSIPEQLDALRKAASLDAQGLALIKFLENWYGSDEPIRQRTSGSTAPPKEILIEKRQMQASARRTNVFFSLDRKSVFLIALGIDYIAGKMQLVRAMEAEGYAIVQAPSSDPLGTLDRAVSFAALIPAQLELGMAHLDKVEKVLLGGVAPTTAQWKIFSGRQQSEIWLGYGMTETCSHVALQQLKADQEAVFVAMEGVRCSVNDLDELCIKDDHLDLELQTTDRVELMDDQRFRWLGRSDQVINAGGRKVQPEQVERSLQPLFSFLLVVCGYLDDRWGEVPVLLYEAMPGLNQRELIEQAISRLDSKDRPRHIFSIQKIPRTPNGKIDRKACRQYVEEEERS